MKDATPGLGTALSIRKTFQARSNTRTMAGRDLLSFSKAETRLHVQRTHRPSAYGSTLFPAYAPVHTLPGKLPPPGRAPLAWTPPNITSVATSVATGEFRLILNSIHMSHTSETQVPTHIPTRKRSCPRRWPPGFIQTPPEGTTHDQAGPSCSICGGPQAS